MVAWLFAVGFLTAQCSADESPTLTDENRGEVLYRAQCASCHGEQGEGIKDAYAQPLIGDRSVVELTKLISETMPDGEPELCQGDDADAVAQYVYDAFYSEIAQARNRPARVEFSRLTVRQYENAVADLFRSFRAWGDVKEQRGLKAQYFNSSGFAGDKKVIERLDATVDFDFGEGSPDGEKIGKDEFAIKWEGSLIASETGVYEFIIRTDNGAKLWLNDERDPLIDAWVRSGDGMEYRGSTRLLGGRVYPLRLEFFKYKDPRAGIRLSWRPPHQAEQVIPTRCLIPEGSSSTFVVSTPFPPDDRSTGFIRGTSVSPEWNEATTFAAIEAANYAVAHRRDLTGIKRDDESRETKLREFCGKFAERAFRRPLSEEERALYIDRQFDATDDFETALKRFVLVVLKSPRFLYREARQGEFDDFDAASWLSFALWDSIPDQPLRDAAARGQLRNRDQIRHQAERMLNDPRARTKVREFLHEWLLVDQVREIAKDKALYPEFSEQLVADLRTSLDLFLDDVVWSESSDFRQLLTADAVKMNRRMADFYGVEIPGDAEFVSVAFQPEHRAGVLSHPYLLTTFAYDKASSPIHRGVWLSRNVLGRVLSPPPIAVAPTPPDLHKNLTTRERVELQTSEELCSRCHSMINPLGFPMEHFDAVGRFRETEQGKPVDAAGYYVDRDGKRIEFTGTRELAHYLAASPETHRAFAERLFQNLVKQPIQAFGPDRREAIRVHFEDHGCNIRDLLVEIATASTLAMRELETNTATASLSE
ncbi:MAG: DUF1592 domain-containing protein [Planctomycetaceae bacterium]|nr:DUF1592 domain-containing protein [Planctomycetaceae bacterium]